MTRTVTALFDDRKDAEAAKERLKQSNVHADHVHIHDKSSAGFRDDKRSTTSEPGMWSSIKNAFLPDEDRYTYEEGVRRGGFLLTADVTDDCVDDAVRVLEESNTIDIDERSEQWRSSGWDYTPGAGSGAMGAMGAMGTGGAGTTGMTDTASYGRTDDSDRLRMGSTDEQVIPIVEEELVVGKREVDRGGVRVRSYVTERPVHEQVRLRDEHVNVERRPVDRKVGGTDDAFTERTIDVTATGEEAVVGKTSRVVEEVVVSKTSDEHVENIDDTVRRTEVDVDRDAGMDRKMGMDRDKDMDRDVGGMNRDRDNYRG